MNLKIIFAVGLLLLCNILILAQEKSRNAETSKVGGKTEPLKIGETAPDFALTDQNGKKVTLSKLKVPVVLVFYRGFWCPFCARQLGELRALLKPYEKVRLYAISVDPAEKSLDLMKKLAKDGKGEINYPLLSDPNHQTIDAFGVFDPAYVGQETEGIPHPAVYILDERRKIIWAKVEPDYKKRPTNEEIRAELDKFK